MPLPVSDYLADFDSGTGMVRALGRFLRGRDFPRLGVDSLSLRVLATFVNRLPRRLREQVYIWSGWAEAIRPERLADVRFEDVSRWVVSQYPRRPYPAVAVGSASGALVHLC